MWWFDSTCGRSSCDQGSHRFFPNVLGDTKKIPGERQRLVVLRRTVNPFPRGKHWRFNSSFAHLGRLQPIHIECFGRGQTFFAENSKNLVMILAVEWILSSRQKATTAPVRLVKRSRHYPFTVETWVQIPYRTLRLNYADCLQLV